MGGVATKNFKMFQKLCAGLAFRNVVVVTNMWGQVDQKVGEAREAELMNDDLFFKVILDKGAHMARHTNTASSARSIIRLILNKKPRPLHIQKELVDDGKGISQTCAGEELNKELNAQIRKHEEEMRALEEEREQAIRENDEEARREIEAESRRMEMKIAKFKSDAQRLVSSYREEEIRLEPARPTLMDGRETDRKVDRYNERIVDQTRRGDATGGISSSGFKKTTAKAVKKVVSRAIGGKNPPSDR